MTDNRAIALVTGSAAGLGQAIAIGLARQGFDVVATARDASRLEATLDAVAQAGRTGWGRELDLADTGSPQQLAAELAAEGIRPQVLVNNGGTGGPVGPLWELDSEAWEEAFAVNVHGTFACCKAFMPAMVERRRGSVITIGSATGKAALPARSAYAASKLALVGLTRTLAVDAGPSGVRVNLVSPANVEGDRLSWALKARADAEGATAGTVGTSMAQQAALKRFVTASEVADVVAYLASDRSTAITGEDINVSAGYVMH